jgi:quinolinate synthase
MKLTSLPDVLNALKGEGGLEIEMDEQTIQKASKCINAMIELGK